MKLRSFALRNRAHHSMRRSGFTLTEVLIASAIAALALVNMHLVSSAGATAAKVGVMKSAIDDELDLTIDRITLAIMGSSRDEVQGAPPLPANSTALQYAVVLGYEDDEAVLSATESISWEMVDDVRGEIQWRRHEDESGDGEEDPRLVWSKHVPNAFLGEDVESPEDDNGNGLLNEHGLAFTSEGDVVEFLLTVERIDDKGERIASKRRHQITCRN